jgi:hypothetical protein
MAETRLTRRQLFATAAAALVATRVTPTPEPDVGRCWSHSLAYLGRDANGDLICGQPLELIYWTRCVPGTEGYSEGAAKAFAAAQP